MLVKLLLFAISLGGTITFAILCFCEAGLDVEVILRIVSGIIGSVDFIYLLKIVAIDTFTKNDTKKSMRILICEIIGLLILIAMIFICVPNIVAKIIILVLSALFTTIFVVRKFKIMSQNKS